MGILSIAKKVADSRAAGGGNWLRDGQGVLIVKKLIQDDMYAGETFIAEFVVESSSSYPDALGPDGKPVLANAPGSVISFIQQFDEYPDTAFGNVKAFILGLMGDTDESLAQQAAVTAQELATNAELVKTMEDMLTDKKSGERVWVNGQPWLPGHEFTVAVIRLCSPAQPARGMRVSYSTFRKTAKKSGKILTLPRWEFYPQDGELIAKTRAQMEGQK